MRFRLFRIAGYSLAFLRALLLILSLLFLVSLGLLLKYTGLLPQKFAFLIRIYWCKFARWVLGIQCIANGTLSSEPGVLYVSNHRSLIDPIILFSYIKNGYAISKAELQNYPLIGLGASLSGVVYVQRTDSKSRSDAKLTMIEILSSKHSIILFPEGTISTERSILPFRKGGFEASIECNTCVVPIALEYMNPKMDFWYTDHILMQFLKTFSKWKTVVNIHFFNPVTDLNPMDLCQSVSARIQSKLNEFQRTWKPEDLPESLRMEV